jgi:hypothetical protein
LSDDEDDGWDWSAYSEDDQDVVDGGVGAGNDIVKKSKKADAVADE